jgi:oligopeptide transport system ATP-binding protein
MSPAGAKASGSTATDRELVRVTDLVKWFPLTRGAILQRQVGAVHAVDEVTFSIGRGETLGLVGESGSGKSTTARLILRLLDPTSGRVELDGLDLTTASGARLRQARQEMQMIFQDPYASLDPRMTVRDIVGEPLVIWGRWRTGGAAQVAELLERVGLNPDHATRFPHEFSGGQRQRIGIARALALRPKLIVCDEPVSALDVSVRAQILNLLAGLQRDFDLTYLFISHDLSVVRQVADQVAVMYLGKLVEVADRDELYRRPLHPYTQALVSAMPIPDPTLERRREHIVLRGDIPSPTNPPSGCRFRTRCVKAQDICAEVAPELVDRGHGHPAAATSPNRSRSSPPTKRSGVSRPTGTSTTGQEYFQSAAAAAGADGAVARGDRVGPLHGVPMTIKEAFNVAGLHTTWGNPDFKEFVADQDATVVRRLRPDPQRAVRRDQQPLGPGAHAGRLLGRVGGGGGRRRHGVPGVRLGPGGLDPDPGPPVPHTDTTYKAAGGRSPATPVTCTWRHGPRPARRTRRPRRSPGPWRQPATGAWPTSGSASSSTTPARAPSRSGSRSGCSSPSTSPVPRSSHRWRRSSSRNAGGRPPAPPGPAISRRSTSSCARPTSPRRSHTTPDPSRSARSPSCSRT